MAHEKYSCLFVSLLSRDTEFNDTLHRMTPVRHMDYAFNGRGPFKIDSVCIINRIQSHGSCSDTGNGRAEMEIAFSWQELGQNVTLCTATLRECGNEGSYVANCWCRVKQKLNSFVIVNGNLPTSKISIQIVFISSSLYL